jgi:hypothetical protein
MATYWAELDANNVVTQVITGVDDDTIDDVPTGVWYTNFLGKSCVQTWIDRDDKIYAGIGYIYDEDTQDFMPPYIEPIIEP